MPVKNRVKEYGAEEYYHVYNRGVNKEEIFRELVDYEYMLSLFKMHLSPEKVFDRFGREQSNYAEEIDLLAYCLMPNHYHLFVYLKNADGLVHLMRSVMTKYSMYFNKKYGRVGSLFQGVFLASRITNDAYFWHVSRYIHLNPLDLSGKDYMNYPYSSIGYYLGYKHAVWLHEEKIVCDDMKREEYADFLASYEDTHDELKKLKHMLAHN